MRGTNVGEIGISLKQEICTIWLEIVTTDIKHSQWEVENVPPPLRASVK
jgi:hypothetical protein